MSDTKTWQQRALDLKPQSKIFIDGNYVDALSGKTFENYSPSDGHLICNVASGDSEDINRAVASAKKAFSALLDAKLIGEKGFSSFTFSEVLAIQFVTKLTVFNTEPFLAST